jgi:hypothetical protein
MTLDDFLSRLSGVRRFGKEARAKCPAHDDKNPSLGISEGDDGRILVICRTGCSTEHVLSTMRLGMKDLMPENGKPTRREIAAYDYRDENGALSFQVVRYEPKDFRQRRPDGAGGWIWSMKGARPCLYRLPELLAAPKGSLVFVCEGEKDVDLLVALGYVATSNPGGTGMGWKDHYSEAFEGKLVCVLEDNDEAGRKHVKKIKESLERYRAARVEIVRLSGLGEGGDVSEWFRNQNNTMAAFDDIVRVSFTHDTLDKEIEKEQVDEDRQELSDRRVWSFDDLVRNRAIKEPEGFLYGELFARGTVSLIMGANSSGKSYFLMFLGGQIARGLDVHTLPTRPGRVLFLSEEMGLSDLRYRGWIVFDDETRAAFGTNRFNVIEHSYFDFSGKTLGENKSVKDFVKICREAGKPDVVFLDSLSRIHTADENSNQAMLIVMRNLEYAARLADCALIVIHHFGKQNEFRKGSARGRGASSIVDAAHDALSVECLSEAKKESLITFHKMRALIGKPTPAPFVFSQEPDPSGRMIERADGQKIQGVVFTVADHEQRETKAEREAKEARDCFERFTDRDPRPEGVNDLGEVARPDAVELFKTAFGWGEKKADRMISRCLSQGLFEYRKEGQHTIIFLPRN